MTQSEIKFSVILPVYNVEKYLERCIKSLLKQTYTNFELICINDCTPDNSAEILSKWAKTDDRIVLLTNEHNIGLGASRNRAVEYARGEYLCCVDSDDWVESNYLETFYNGFKNNDVDSVWVKFWRYKENLDLATLSMQYPRFTHRLAGKFEITPKNINDFPAYAWNKCLKTDMVRHGGFKWMENVYFEDIYFYYDFFMKHHRVYLYNELLYYYRDREGSIVSTSSNKLRRIRDMYKVLTAIYHLIEEKNYSNDYKEPIKLSAKRYYNSYKNSEYPAELQDAYDKFLAVAGN